MIKLLLVEDDASLAYIEKTGLEDIIGGYEVTTATNGKEGLQAWQETNPDVIISDIDMPVMNGFEMVERIRETDGNVIIIFTSALTSPNDVKAGYRLSPSTHLHQGLYVGIELFRYEGLLYVVVDAQAIAGFHIVG